MSFWGELKRRKGVQVAAVYAITAWLLVQIIVAIEGPLSLPGWMDTFVIVCLAIGFPITLIISWAFNLTPEGLVRDRGGSSMPASGRSLEYALIGLLALAVAWLLYRDVSSSSSPALAASSALTLAREPVAEVLPNSIAVLPCDNLSPNPDDAFFVASLHEELQNQLVKLGSLNVIARTSVLQYAGAARPITEIARELKVESIMACSVSYGDGRVAISTQLIDADSGIHLWSERYNRVLEDVFGIQADIAINVANALEAQLSDAEQQRIERPRTDSTAAYAYYLRALQAGDSADRGELLEQAIRLDPDFASAQAALAGHLSSGLVAVTPTQRDEVERRAREHAAHALALDPEEPRAYSALGYLDLLFWRWTEARRSYEQAFELGEEATAAAWPWLQAWLGDDPREVMRRLRRGVELSPVDYEARWYLGMGYAYARDYDAAAATMQEALELAPAFAVGRYWLAGIEVARGNVEAAREEHRLAEQLMGDNRVPLALAELAHIYGLAGAADDARRIVTEIEALGAHLDIGSGAWALAYLAIGDHERALRWLERGAEKADRKEFDPAFIGLMHLRLNPFSDPVLEQPEFREIRDRLRGA